MYWYGNLLSPFNAITPHSVYAWRSVVLSVFMGLVASENVPCTTYEYLYPPYTPKRE